MGQGSLLAAPVHAPCRLVLGRRVPCPPRAGRRCGSEAREQSFGMALVSPSVVLSVVGVDGEHLSPSPAGGAHPSAIAVGLAEAEAVGGRQWQRRDAAISRRLRAAAAAAAAAGSGASKPDRHVRLNYCTEYSALRGYLSVAPASLGTPRLLSLSLPIHGTHQRHLSSLLPLHTNRATFRECAERSHLFIPPNTTDSRGQLESARSSVAIMEPEERHRPPSPSVGCAGTRPTR